MDIRVESYLQSVIFPDLERGRPNWDLPHTKAVVQYAKTIMHISPAFQVDQDVLIIAAHAHDWGYSGLFESGRPVTLRENLDKKAEHMRLGAEKTEALLTDAQFDFLSAAQKERIVHLVAVHDSVTLLHDADELILMEADTLGTTDPTVVEPTLTRAEYKKWRAYMESERVPRFITAYSKAKITELLHMREHYYLTHNL